MRPHQKRLFRPTMAVQLLFIILLLAVHLFMLSILQKMN
ncbi:hypothetical protein MODO_1635 [Myroides odoratimimus]|nr:hypothetical protein MODO_1635 [Myroides odoratimimus]